MNFNKEIKKMWLLVTTRCNMRCKYCFIEKTDEDLSQKKAEEVIKAFIFSRGKEKQLLICGGEPILYFKLLKKIIPLTRFWAKKQDKSVIISLATNGTLIKKKHLDFLKKYKVKLAISIDGKRGSHNKFRVFKDGEGSFSQLSRNLPLIFKNFKKENICALMAIHPLEVKKMYDNFVYLTKLGFKSVNIEPIQTITWGEREREEFSRQLDRIFDYIIKEIENKRFLFLNCVSRIIARQEAFNKLIGVHPSGKIGDSCFCFYPNISFDINIIRLRNRASRKLVRILLKKAQQKDSPFFNYLEEIESYVFD